MRQPVSFTQEDPLGLAGGLNVYGFAAGDPVNFSDPFGLQACYLWSDKNSPDCIAAHRNVESCMSGGPCEYTIGIVPDISPGGRGLIKWARDLGVAGRRGATLVRQAANLRGYLMHLTASDLRGAARELRGLQSGGQHLQEVREAVGGLRGFIDDLNQALSNPNLSELERTGFGSLLGVASRALDRAEAALR